MARLKSALTQSPEVLELLRGYNCRSLVYRDDKGRAVTFRKISDLDGQSYERLLQSERDIDAACGAAGKLASAAGDHHILLSVDHVGCGCCCTGERQ
jgi:hypothetical protein